MSEQHDARVETSERSEFQRLVEGHVSDIKALAVFYGRQGWDRDILGRTLTEAAENLREVAYAIPSARDDAQTEDETGKVVRIASVETDRWRTRSTSS